MKYFLIIFLAFLTLPGIFEPFYLLGNLLNKALTLIQVRHESKNLKIILVCVVSHPSEVTLMNHLSDRILDQLLNPTAQGNKQEYHNELNAAPLTWLIDSLDTTGNPAWNTYQQFLAKHPNGELVMPYVLRSNEKIV